ncbi:bifunctional oligoribonuclease/PAP phosphatase NrnA [Carnobacteriaceae bacterium zg-C25]|nr:bifunctional oligoribonuclease/PAP phosphatase NrnA [Carnobacteriaceae bacterium zg-ZUI240]QTU82586.1 bifunctional oligoribonuclease/PAP phosphatase NrnA [Carnobacteriaceae bacterium zg-C25]
MISFKTIIEKIKAYDTIIIHRHVHPDPDAYGSQLGLAQLIKDNFSKRVYCVGEQLDGLSWIGQMDVIDDVVYNDALVIVVDTANTARIDDARYVNGKELIKIDHHPNVEPYSELLYVDTTASSVSEIMCEFAFESELTISCESARLLYAGIIGDTNRFLYNNATPKTMSLVSRLRETVSFDNVAIHNMMMEKTLEQARLNGYVLQHLNIEANGALATVILTQDILKQFGVTNDQTESVVSLPGSIAGVKVWVIFVEKEDGTYRVNLRSKGPIVNGIAAQHDGGGHPLASGANAKDRQEVDVIISELTTLALEG